jgi:hypothetical protein
VERRIGQMHLYVHGNGAGIKLCCHVDDHPVLERATSVPLRNLVSEGIRQVINMLPGHLNTTLPEGTRLHRLIVNNGAEVLIALDSNFDRYSGRVEVGEQVLYRACAAKLITCLRMLEEAIAIEHQADAVPI